MALQSRVKMVRLPVISLWWLPVLAWAGDELTRNNDAALLLARMAQKTD